MHVLFMMQDILAATSTVSPFALIGPPVGYAGVHGQAESMHQTVC